jgi:hypothetical protein
MVQVIRTLGSNIFPSDAGFSPWFSPQPLYGGRPRGRRGAKMRGAGLLWFAGIVFGQQALWEKHVQEGDRLAQAGRYQEAREAYQFALRDPDTPTQPGVQAARWNDLALMNRSGESCRGPRAIPAGTGIDGAGARRGQSGLRRHLA